MHKAWRSIEEVPYCFSRSSIKFHGHTGGKIALWIQFEITWPVAAIKSLRFALLLLKHWGRVTLICTNRITNIGSDNGLSPGRRQAIIWTNVGILLIRTLGTNFSEILSEMHTFSFKKMHLKMSSAKWRPFCLGLNVLSFAYFHRLEGWMV